MDDLPEGINNKTVNLSPSIFPSEALEIQGETLPRDDPWVPGVEDFNAFLRAPKEGENHSKDIQRKRFPKLGYPPNHQFQKHGP